MSHQDRDRVAVPMNHQLLRQALQSLLAPGIFGRLTFRCHCSWTPTSLVAMVLLWVWSEETALTDRFHSARKITKTTLALQHELAASYQAFVKMLRRHTNLLMFAAWECFQRCLREDLKSCYKTAGFVVFGVDGSRLDVPRTTANEARFGSVYKNKKHRRGRRRRTAEKKVSLPRIWLTTLWHVGSGLPWCWKHGAGNSSEREHLQQMLDHLPAETLLTADAGFTGYDFWQSLLDRGHHFLVRIGSNVKLLKNLGYARCRGEEVYLWPDKAAKKRQPPLRLRLLVLEGEKEPVYLVTSVMSRRRLSDSQLSQLYRSRWGIEVFYRSFKRTFQRHKLRSTSPDNALLELDWSLVGLWAVCLYAKRIQYEQGLDISRTSTAGVLRAMRRTMRHYQGHPPVDEQLVVMLCLAVIDDYIRGDKSSRDYPRKKKRSHTHSPPVILDATTEQVQKAQEIKKEERQKKG